MKTNYRIIVLSLIALLMGMQEGWGQYDDIVPKGNRYDNTHQDVSIQHRAPKWNTTDGMMVNPWKESAQIQKAHIYVDTIYMRKGTFITLTLPDKMGNDHNHNSYQRWYNYRTEGTFKYKPLGTTDGDLLNPVGSVAPYRFQNGYVGQPYLSSPAEQMVFFYPSDLMMRYGNVYEIPNPDNDYYIVACDVSNYTDYDTNTPKEPTLTHRVLFYIVGVNGGYDSPNTSAFEQAMNSTDFQTDGSNYWEEYEITFPAIRFSSHTLDGIALSKDANAYAIPAVDYTPVADNTPLQVTLEDHGSGISLATTTLSGENRIIQFRYPSDRKGIGGVVSDGSSATILVRKTVGGKTYNLARYQLTFKDGFQQLTQSQVKQLDENTVPTNSWWKNYDYRTENYLEQHYNRLAKLDFDNYNHSNNGYSAKPLNWEDCSYGFYDGTLRGQGHIGNHSFPEWGNYGITSGEGWYVTKQNVSLPGSQAHMYIDASDRPGVIARLPFETQLCAGSELFFSAWVKSGSKEGADPQMLFTLLGVKEEGGTKIHVPLYRYSTGAIPQGNLLRGRSEPGLVSNDWFQIYFSFVNKGEQFTQYLLQIENNSSSTSGGDMYLDDIRVYVAAPQVNAIQHKALCNQTKNPHVQVLFDWEQISAMSVGTSDANKISLAVIASKDSSEFKAGGSASETNLINLWNGSTMNQGTVTYFTLSYNSTFEANNEYSLTTEGDESYAAKTEGSFLRYVDGKTGKKYLTVDLYGNFTPNVDYTILAQRTNRFNVLQFAGESYYKRIPCTTYKEFRLTAKNDIVVNGTVLDPTNVCAGQTYNFQIQMKAQNPETGALHVINQTIYHDWFFGTETDFNKENSSCGNNTLNNALEKFRQYYPNTDNDLTGVTATGKFTQAMLDLIKKHMAAETGYAKLVLYQSSLNIQLQERLDLVIKPIQQTLTGIQDEWVCWEYKTLSMTFGSERSAPSLKVGFADVTYPPYYNQALRIGLEQLKATGPSNLLRIPIHNIQRADGGLATIPMLNDLFLIETDDPEWQAHLDAHSGGEYEYEFAVGKVQRFEPTDVAESGFVDIYFYNHTVNGTSYVLEPHEGYHYYFGFHFTSQSNSGACNGRAVILLKIVPEYQVWKGNASSDWTNRNNWQRATAADLHTSASLYDDYAAPYAHKGYAPMPGSKIILPEGKKMTLKAPEYKNPGATGNAGKILQLSASASEGADRDIEYDLVVKEATGTDGIKYDCEPYSINRVSEVHFEPNAEMLHAELLEHEKAWVDYRVQKGRWQLLSSPFKNKGMFAGDWYTGTDGNESTAYFSDINFGTRSRINPAVYQRSWGGTANLITEGGNNTTNGVAFNNGWSALYNDMNVAYNPGSGFSLKVMGDKENYTFRFPKADTQYSYYSYNNNNGSLTANGSTGSLSRAEDQKLAVSALNGEATELIINPSFGSSDFYMVGNPFMAHLNMHKFFAENTGLEKTYWTLNNQRAITSGEERQEWIATAVNDGAVPTIAPMQAFFVKKTNGASETIKITAAMQTLDESSKGSTNSANALTRTKAQATANASVKEPHTLQIQSIGESRLMVLATEPIRFLGVYTLDGRQLWVEIPQTTERILSLPAGIYVIRAVTDSQTQSTKIIVR